MKAVARPKIKLTVVEKLGQCGCHHGHQVGDQFDFDKDRGVLCPMALHAGFPYIDILRYGGELPLSQAGDVRFCCPDADVANVFRVEVEQE
ncbi:MAG: TIGR04076 family protein [Acutalibacter sp.]